MLHTDESELLALARVSTHLLSLFWKPGVLCSPRSLGHSFKLKFKGLFIYAKSSTGYVTSVCVRGFFGLETSFFESWISFLPLPSTKLASRHFWKGLAFVSTWSSPKAGKIQSDWVFCRFLKGVFGEDGWRQDTSTTCQEGYLHSGFFSNFGDDPRGTGPHPINGITFTL